MSDAAFRMDRMYAWQTGIYDFTRKPYLLGRDTLIGSLAPPLGGNVLEIGCGTGRNLVQAARRWPNAQFFGFDVSRAMLAKAEKSIADAGLGERVKLAQGDANAFPNDLFPVPRFERVYFSYTLSMVPDWERVLERSLACLAPGGSLLIADFGDQRDLPPAFKVVLKRWLSLFHVEPRVELESVLRDLAARAGLRGDFVRLYRGYAFLAALHRA